MIGASPILRQTAESSLRCIHEYAVCFVALVVAAQT
jgi:hypothetical protein